MTTVPRRELDTGISKQTRSTRPSGSMSGNKYYGGLTGADYERDTRLLSQNRWRTYSQLIGSIPILGTAMRLEQALMSRLRFNLKAGPADTTGEIRQFFQEALFEDPRTSMRHVSGKMALARWFGVELFEFWYRMREDGRYTIADIQERDITTIVRPAFDVINGERRLTGYWQYADRTQGASVTGEVFLPIDKLLVRTDAVIGTDPMGLGIMRTIAPVCLWFQDLMRGAMVKAKDNWAGTRIVRTPKTDTNNAIAQAETREEAQDILANYNETADPAEAWGRDGNSLKTGAFLHLDSGLQTVVDQNSTGIGETTRVVPVFKEIAEILKGDNTGQAEHHSLMDRFNRWIAEAAGIESVLAGSGPFGNRSTAEEQNDQLYIILDSGANLMDEILQRQLIYRLASVNGIERDRTPTITHESIVPPTIQEITAVGDFQMRMGVPVTEFEDNINLARARIGLDALPEGVTDIADDLSLLDDDPSNTDPNEEESDE